MSKAELRQIQRARSEHSVLEIFGCDVVMTQMQYRDNNKPVVNAGPGIPKQWSKSGIHDQSRVSGLMCTSCCSFLPASRAQRQPAACGVSSKMCSLHTPGDIRAAPYTPCGWVFLTATGPCPLVVAGLLGPATASVVTPSFARECFTE